MTQLEATPLNWATFSPPPGWERGTLPSGIRYTAPEGDLSVTIIELTAGDSAAAIAGAMTGAGLDATGPVRGSTDEPPRKGWRGISTTVFETPPAARTWSQAVAFAGADAWTVVVLHGAMATFEKRAAAVMLVLQSLAAQGYQEEAITGEPKPVDDALVQDMLDFLRAAMTKLAIPGVGFALVHDDRIVFEGGLGVRSADRAEPVDAHTLFPIASNTKGLTTLLLAALVDDGRVGWDHLVSRAYPAFRLGDPALTDRIEVRHLVSAATGLPRKDLVWSFTNRADTPATRVFELLAGETPTSGFGEVYQYNNLMAAAAGFIAGHLAYPEGDPGAGYDRALRERIFGPLEMNATTFSVTEVAKGNHVWLHGVDAQGRNQAIDPEITITSYPSRPSGGAWSSAHDMIRYVRLEVMEGALPSGEQLVSRINLLARRQPGVAMGANTHYGMGLITHDESGITVVHHGGSTPGGMSDICIIPQAKVGAVLLTNSDSGMFLLGPFRRRLIELLYDARPVAMAEVESAAARLDSDLAHFMAGTEVAPSLPLPRHYTSPELGDLWTEGDGETLAFRFSSVTCPMRVRREENGALSFVTAHPVLRGIVFAATADDFAELTIREGQHEYRLTACAEKRPGGAETWVAGAAA